MQMVDRLDRVKSTSWMLIYTLIAAAWVATLFLGESSEMRELALIYGPAFWAEMCDLPPDLAGFLRLVLMWAVMAAAIMLPAMLPAFAAFDELTIAGAQNRGELSVLVLGFLLTWAVFAVLAAGAQMWLVEMGVATPLGQSLTPYLNAAMMALAGAYQLSRTKAACLNRCRDPLVFFVENWQPGPFSALRMGLWLGAVCIGSTWALMLLGFVGGVMSLLWMGAALVFISLERMPWSDRSLPFASGLILLGGAALQLGAMIL